MRDAAEGYPAASSPRLAVGLVDRDRRHPTHLRHSYATRLLRAGVKAEVVQKLLGHASVPTTIDTYAHLGIEDVRRDLVRTGVLADTTEG